jgi:hypothetical protein
VPRFQSGFGDGKLVGGTGSLAAAGKLVGCLAGQRWLLSTLLDELFQGRPSRGSLAKEIRSLAEHLDGLGRLGQKHANFL